jgi:hypothetical protein
VTDRRSHDSDGEPVRECYTGQISVDRKRSHADEEKREGADELGRSATCPILVHRATN